MNFNLDPEYINSNYESQIFQILLSSLIAGEEIFDSV